MITFAAEMGRILAIDFGTKRTGIAATDPLRIIASAVETVPTHTLFEWLGRYFATEVVDTVVVGKPLQMSGAPSESMVHIEPFVRRLQREFPDKRVVWHDERFTSRMAQRAIIDGGVPKMARRDKSLVDKVSAAIILRDYMDSREYKMQNEG